MSEKGHRSVRGLARSPTRVDPARDRDPVSLFSDETRQALNRQDPLPILTLHHSTPFSSTCHSPTLDARNALVTSLAAVEPKGGGEAGAPLWKLYVPQYITPRLHDLT
ncbi:hypothetical protein EVAR_12852_1 [Eumeta japonica]|uniref:Uncharacterized protein n=1 Tax=Eumeta variegata TaxID=151549 RepID=A0A4C1SKM8_EUMVA|nr:hypothetical protein EVAR_12852_1 [Eumeta japonica]